MLDKLPPEIIILLFQILGFRTVLEMAKVSKQLHTHFASVTNAVRTFVRCEQRNNCVYELLTIFGPDDGTTKLPESTFHLPSYFTVMVPRTRIFSREDYLFFRMLQLTNISNHRHVRGITYFHRNRNPLSTNLLVYTSFEDEEVAD